MFRGKSAIHEMAKGTWFCLGACFPQMMANSIRNFPWDNAKAISFDLLVHAVVLRNVGYVFFQLFHDEPGDGRPNRSAPSPLLLSAVKSALRSSGGLISRKSSASLLTRQNTRLLYLEDSTSWIARTQRTVPASTEAANEQLRFLSD